MNRIRTHSTSILIAALSLALSGCDTDVQEPSIQCTTWAACEGGLVLDLNVADGAFRRSSTTRYVPGDTILLRGRLENRSTLDTDSIQLIFRATGLSGFSPRSVSLQAGTSYAFVDTVVVAGFTFDAETRISVDAWRFVEPVDYLPLKISGDTQFDIARSGYRFELIPIAGVRSPLVWAGYSFVGIRIRHQTQIAVMAKVTNVYETDLPPIGMGLCFWDFDNCYAQYESSNKTKVLKPGESTYLEMEFPLDTKGRYFDWWSQRLVGINICAEHGYMGRQCTMERILIIANYEVDCTVREATIGAPVHSTTHDCGYYDDGSAYRFTARAGERYRVSRLSGSGSVFITDADGAPNSSFGPMELVIPRDGTYYVAAFHRDPLSFLLERL
jgi:hypothetical protein